MAATKAASNTYAGAIYRTRGQAYYAVTETQGGTGMLTFADRNNGTVFVHR